MFPDKVADAAVLQDHLEGAVLALVCGHRAADRHIVYVGNGEPRNIRLKSVMTQLYEVEVCELKPKY